MSTSSSSSSSSSSSPTSSAALHDSIKSPSSLLTQLTAIQSKFDALVKAPSSTTTTSPLDTVLPLYTSLLTPLFSLAPSSPFFSQPTSPLLIDGLLTGLNRLREVKGMSAVVILHLKALTALATLSKPYARTIGHKGVVLVTINTMKTYGKLRKVLLECLQLLFAVHRAQPDHATGAVHPFTRGKLHGVNLYRRLFDILSNPSFRSYRSLLTPTLDLVLILLKLSITTTKTSTTTPPPIEKRLRFAIPPLMELAYLLTFGTTTLQKDKHKKTLRPRTPSTHMFKSLILVLSRLSCLPGLVPVMVRLGGCEWGVEVLKEMRDHVPSVSAIVLMLLNIAKDQQEGCPTLSAIVAGKEEDMLLRYVAPSVDAKHQLLFRHTRDLLWQLALFCKKEGAVPYHYGYNVLDESYFGKRGNDYHVKFEFLDRQKVARMESLQEMIREEEEEGGEEVVVLSDDEDESDGLESDRGEDEDDGIGAERRSMERGEVEGKESFDSEGESEEEEEAKSPKKARESWVEVKLSEKAVKVSQELKSEDVEDEEREEEDAGMKDEEEEKKDEPKTEQQRPIHRVMAKEEEKWEVNDYLPERWDKASEAVQATLAKHQKEVETAKTNSVRHWINRAGERERIPTSSPDSSPPFSSLTPSATDLLHSTMFSHTTHALPPAPTAVYPEPLHVVPPSQYLHDLNTYYNTTPPSDFTPRVVYDRNVLDALHSMSGEFIADPLTVFNAHPSLTLSNPPSLSFDSRFESGNLSRATQLSPTHYRLELSNDLNTNAHTQWFLFRCRNMQPGVQYRFDIVNLEKKTSAFGKGMKPAMYSEKEAVKSGVGWCRALLAERVYYYGNHVTMQPRMTKAEVVARTPRLSLAEQVMSRGHSREGSGVDGVGFVDVEDVLRKGNRFTVGDGVKGEAGALLTSFLTSDSPLDRSSSSTPFASAPLTPHAERPTLNRTFSSPPTSASTATAPQYHSTLSFTISFVHNNDTVYLSHFYPYTFTYLHHQLATFQSQCPHLIRQPLCYTRIGNMCELLTITDLSPSSLASSPLASRPYIVLTSRVHPGETNSSWALDGLLSFLTSSSPIATHLRSLVVFKVVPMLNIDGVIEGNYRTNLSGLDLNRYWGRPGVKECGTIHAAKELVMGLSRAGKVLMFVDWHGHSTMASTGLYGCNARESTIKPREATEEERKAEEEDDWLGVIPPKDVQLKERLFPMLVSQRGNGLFSYGECTYNVTQYKAGSARVVVWQGLRLPATYTLETTFYGTDTGKLQGIHWNTEHYRKIGKAFGMACYDLVNPDRSACIAAYEQVKAQYNPKKDKHAA